MLKGFRRARGVTFDLQGVPIRPSKKIKCLGIHLDIQGTFGQHMREACARADNHTRTLQRLLPNIKGPSSGKRRVLLDVIHSIMLYGAPVWHDVLNINRYRNILIKTQRKILLRVASEYRTVSAVSLQTIAGVPPIDLMVRERRRLHDRKDGATKQARKEERQRTVEVWQSRWNNEQTVAQRTKRLIPDIKRWLNCNHRMVR